MTNIRDDETQETEEQQRPATECTGSGSGRDRGGEVRDVTEEFSGGPESQEPNSTQGQNLVSPATNERCLAVTERFRLGELPKAMSILLICGILTETGISSEAESFVSALDSYITILDGFERFRNSASSRGTKLAPSRDSSPDRDSIDNNVPSGSLHIAERKLTDSSASSKRARSSSPDEDVMSPRRRINSTQFPWIIQEEKEPTVLSPTLRQTQTALENFSRDIKYARASLINSPNCPQFPDSEWTNLLSGRAIDFDRVLSSLYSVSLDDQRRERLGDIEIIAGSVSPARTVRSHSEWVIACDSAWEATLFVFPHRNSELAAYGKYIKQLFASFPVSRHLRVIQFDKAVRIRAAQRRNLLLTDHASFADLTLLWLQNAGAINETDNQSRRPLPPRRREACRRWNEGVCPNGNNTCTYAHICSKCRNTGHTVANCTQTTPSTKVTSRK